MAIPVLFSKKRHKKTLLVLYFLTLLLTALAGTSGKLPFSQLEVVVLLHFSYIIQSFPWHEEVKRSSHVFASLLLKVLREITKYVTSNYLDEYLTALF